MHRDAQIPMETENGASIAFNDTARTQNTFRINIESALIDAYADQVIRRLVY